MYSANQNDDLSKRLEQEETEKRIDKLDLEQRSLHRQLSWSGTLLTWLQAASVPAALIGVLVTFSIGSKQVHVAEENRAADRFDKALTRLASERASERITGVSGIAQFATESDVERQEAALHVLINAIALEADEFVSRTMVDVFRGLKKDVFNRQAIDRTLERALERSRSTFGRVKNAAVLRSWDEQSALIAKKFNVKWDRRSSFQLPDELKGRLSLSDLFQYRLSGDTFFTDRVTDAEQRQLLGLGNTINELIRLGARGTDFSEIYCASCNFSPLKELEKANFARAYLDNANFARIDLSNASFRDASISYANFFGAKLNGADMSVTSPFVLQFSRTEIPALECADITGTDLTGRVLLTVDRHLFGDKTMFIRMTSLELAKTDAGTKFGGVTIQSSDSTAVSQFRIASKDDRSPLNIAEEYAQSDLQEGASHTFRLHRKLMDANAVERLEIRTIKPREADRIKAWLKPIAYRFAKQGNLAAVVDIAAFAREEWAEKGFYGEKPAVASSGFCDAADFPPQRQLQIFLTREE